MSIFLLEKRALSKFVKMLCHIKIQRKNTVGKDNILNLIKIFFELE